MSEQVNPRDVTVKVTTGGKVHTAPLEELLKRSMKPANIFRSMVDGSIRHHEALLKEVRAYVLRHEVFPGLVDDTWEGTITYMLGLQEQIDLSHHAKKYFDEEAPFDYFPLDSMRTIELEAE